MSMESRGPESVVTPVDQIIADFIVAVESGRRPDPEDYLSRFPQFASELRQFFSGFGMLDEIARKHSKHVASTGVGISELSDTRPLGSPSNQKPLQFPKKLGRYRLQRLLGKGAMGAVFLANDVELGRQVALKVPTVDMKHEPTLRERFYREARAAAMLQHPNICTVYEVGEAAGFQFIAMAYVAGAPLSRFVKSAEPLTLRKVALTIKKLAKALNEAHQAGIVHRDLKPSNIMINKSGEPIIMDFGLARLNRYGDDIRVTTTGMIIGSPAYMSPEQVTADHDVIGPATDIYGLGVVMFELLTGQLPFTGNGKVLALIAQVQRDQPPRPSSLRMDVPPELDQICLQMLEKSPSDRQGSMKEVAEQLDDFLAGRFSIADPNRDPSSSVTPNSDGESETLAWTPWIEDETHEKLADAELFRIVGDDIVFVSATASCVADTKEIDSDALSSPALTSVFSSGWFIERAKTSGAHFNRRFAWIAMLLVVGCWGAYELGNRLKSAGPGKTEIANVPSPHDPDLEMPPDPSPNTIAATVESKETPIVAPTAQALSPPPIVPADPNALPRPELVLISAPHRSSLLNGGVLLHLGVRNESRFPRGIKLRAQVFDNDERLLFESTLADGADLRGRIVLKLAASQSFPEQIRLHLTDLDKHTTVVSDFVSTSTVTGIRTIPIPIIGQCNHGLHDDLQVPGRVQVRQNGLTELSVGAHIYGGVQFEIEDGVIDLQSITTPALLPVAYDLRVDQAAACLHFLIGCSVTDPDMKIETAIAQIHVNYKSGEQESFPIEYGVHVESLLSDLGKTPLRKGTLAWVGANRDSLTRAAVPQSVRLYVTSWTNPHPEGRIDSIDIHSNKSAAGLVCVAAALESPDDSEPFTQRVELTPLDRFADSGAVEWQQAQRDVVSWALAADAVVFISGRSLPVTKADKLPTQFSVTSLGFESSEVTDQDLARFELLTKLNYLKLKKASVNGNGFKHLAGLPELSHLVLDGSKIDDEWLADLVSLPALQHLELQETTITDSGLSSLVGCPRLEQLRVSRVVLTELGVANLKAITSLKSLWCDCDETSIKRIARELSLLELTLQSPREPVMVVVELTKMPSLRSLKLLDVAGSDGLVKALGKLNQLRNLKVSGFSRGNMVQLRAMLPECKVQDR